MVVRLHFIVCLNIRHLGAERVVDCVIPQRCAPQHPYLDVHLRRASHSLPP